MRVERNTIFRKTPPSVVSGYGKRSINLNKVVATLECLFRMVTSVSMHSFVEWLDTFSYVLRPADATVKEVNHISCFAIDIAKYLILHSCP
jgi:hypothetical protein